MDIGVIGVGAMGRNHVRLYSELKSVDSLSICDTNRAAAEQIARGTDITVCASVGELAKSVDAVSICVPTPYHHAIAQECLQQGIDLLVEKPICQSSAEAERLIRQIPEEAIVGVGHIERFNPIVGEIRRIMRNPLYVEAKRHNPASARITGSSVIEDLMIHDIDVIFSLFPDGECRIQSCGNDDICSALLELNGVPIHVSASRKASKKIRMIYIEEEDRTIEGDYMTQEIFVYRKPDQYQMENARYSQENIIEKVLLSKVEPLRTELSTFLDCVKTRKPFPITPQQALRNLQVCERIQASFAARSVH